MRIPPVFEFECPVKTHCGDRALEHIPFELRAMGVTKPLVIGDAAARDGHRFKAALKGFRNADMTLGIVETMPDAAPQAVVPQLAAIYRDKDCDGIVAIGQGPAIDAIKWLNLAVSSGQESLDPFVGGSPVPRVLKPLAVIPPAAADGFELSGYLRIGSATLRSVSLMPHLLFVDRRTAGAPEDAAMVETALVALTHSVESFFGAEANPMTGVYARTGAMLAASALHQLAHRGGREGDLALSVAHAAALGGCALGAGAPSTTHALAAAVAESGRSSAAQAMGILLSYTLEYRATSGLLNAGAVLELLGGRDRYARTPGGQRGPAAIYFLRNLLNLLFERTDGRVKRTLQDLGMTREELQQAADRASANGVGETQAAAILTHAWEGCPFLEMA